MSSPSTHNRSSSLRIQDQDIGQDAVPADADQEEQWFADWSAIARYGWNPFLHNPTLADHLHRVKAPTLVIASDDDRITGPGYAHAFAERVPGAELKTVANSGHALPLERPGRVLRPGDRVSLYKRGASRIGQSAEMVSDGQRVKRGS